MDPHSRRSQFNQRAPKAGPPVPTTRFPDPLTTHNKLSKQQPFSTQKYTSSTSLTMRRPIATNSRIKQGEKYRKDVYLAFVNNALQQKSNGITEPFDELVGQFNPNRQPGEGAQQPAQLRLWILALSHVVSRLERTHSALVEAIVNMPWTTMDAASVKSYTVFIGMLLSARPEYLSLVLDRIAQGFTHQSGIQALNGGLPEASSSPLTRRVIYDRLHYLLRHLLSLIPTLPSTLQPLLVRHFPHKRQNQVAQSTYIRNLLRISGYCPELAGKILATIVDRAIQIDVEIQVELEELEEDESPEDQDVFELDPFDTVVGQEDDDDDSDEEDNENDDFSDLSSDGGDLDNDAIIAEIPTNAKHIQEMVKKLDAILTLIFDHFQRTQAAISSSSSQSASQPGTPLDLPPLPPLATFSPDLLSPSIDIFSLSQLTNPIISTSTTTSLPTPSSESSRASLLPSDSQILDTTRAKALLRNQFLALLAIFDRTILRTFKSRYTQFLVFWYTSLDPEFADIFQGMLVDRALFQDPTCNSTPIVTRAAAASYIGSFVSRATFVHREDARRVVAVLCDFLGAHLDEVEETVRVGGTVAVGAAQNTVFYAVAQAVFLIFCFRWRELLEDTEEGEDLAVGVTEKRGKKWMPELNVLQRVVTCVLNPLKVCSSNVVMQFARVAHATDFIYCYTILESNKRSEYGSSSSQGNRKRHEMIHPAIFGEPSTAELNTFFPFDPYRLPRSNVYIQQVYREWSSVAINSGEEEEEEDEEEEEEEEEEEDGEDLETLGGSGYLTIPRMAEDTMGLGQSLGAMSISPVQCSLKQRRG